MLSGGLVNENGTIFFTFTTDHEFTTGEIDGIAVKIAKFGNAKTTRKKQFNDGAIAEAGFGVDGNFGK